MIAVLLNTEGRRFHGERWTARAVRRCLGEAETIAGRKYDGRAILNALHLGAADPFARKLRDIFTARRAESEARANERFAASLSHAAAFELVAVLRDEGCDWSSIADELNTDGLHYEGH